MDMIFIVFVFLLPASLLALIAVIAYIDNVKIDYSKLKRISTGEVIEVANLWNREQYLEEKANCPSKYRLSKGSVIVHSKKTRSKCALTDRCIN